jgi:hypothetical protein
LERKNLAEPPPGCNAAKCPWGEEKTKIQKPKTKKEGAVQNAPFGHWFLGFGLSRSILH